MRVDVKGVLKEKKPGLARWTPAFVVNWLRRVLHEDEVNFYLESFSHLPSIEFVRATLRQMEITYTAVGIEKLDRRGRYIFASNHPFGGLDGLMLADEVSRYFGDVRVIVNDLLMNLTPLKDIFVPINKHGRQNPEYARLYNEAFDSDMPLVTFPAGLCSRREKGVVRDLKWKPNFIKRAVSSGRDVVPVYFDGELSNFFYRLSNFRKRGGVKINIEMLWLADEMFKQHGRHFDIFVGDPIPCGDLEEMKPSQACELVRTKAYNLKKEATKGRK